MRVRCPMGTTRAALIMGLVFAWIPWYSRETISAGFAMPIDHKTVARVARLARLHVSADDIARYAPQLDTIMKFVEQLDEVDTGSVRPLASVSDIAPAPPSRRCHRWRRCGQGARQRAPKRSKDFTSCRKSSNDQPHASDHRRGACRLLQRRDFTAGDLTGAHIAATAAGARAECLHHRNARACPAPGPGKRRAPGGGQGGCARWYPVGDQGSVLHRRRAHDRVEQDPGKFRAAL